MGWNAPLPFPFPLPLRRDDVAIAFSKLFFANSFGDSPNRNPNDDDDKGFFTTFVVVVGENVALRVVLQILSQSAPSIGAQNVEFRNVPVDRTRCVFLVSSIPRKELEEEDDKADGDDNVELFLLLAAAATFFVAVAALLGFIKLFDLLLPRVPPPAEDRPLVVL